MKTVIRLTTLACLLAARSTPANASEFSSLQTSGLVQGDTFSLPPVGRVFPKGKPQDAPLPPLQQRAGASFNPDRLDTYDSLKRYELLDVSDDVERAFVIGDVHGAYDPLTRLLNKANYQRGKDLLVFVGDLVIKGSKSIEVLDLAIQEDAKCVRGNYEDLLLSYRAEMDRFEQHGIPISSGYNNGVKDLAAKMTDSHWKYIESCPLVLELPARFGQATMRNPLQRRLLIAHASLDLSKDMEHQDPYATIWEPYFKFVDGQKFDTGREWLANLNRHVFNQVKQDPALPVPLVLYGHDEDWNVNINSFSDGLDTLCYLRGQLTAMTYPDNLLHQESCETEPEYIPEWKLAQMAKEKEGQKAITWPRKVAN
ncbi:hypothetical protein IWQ60_000826 [Tieghemiomyces parasiticus]|uniref:Calcineurin-like phosphoesterase domain-containing protein n=1 Tax=Tieghemiomyces parasiticus TaxID=78921 RepID=A0A9W8AE56_9FUNG|nr:hypothetical protein IWQ60_000826 [Tieghemiomyces parasiticus]